MAKVNDRVRFLNMQGGGRISKIQGNIAYVEEDDGFETPVLISELVVVDQSKSTPSMFDRPILPSKSKEVPAPKATIIESAPTIKVEETPGGDVLNVVLAYEPKEINHLNTTTYFAFLVNDSNYFLQFSYMTRDDQSGLWTVRFNDLVEPNTQILLEEFDHSALTEMSRVAVQYIAFKKQGPFKLKTPALVEYHLDTTKFYKLHCFHDSEYFDTKVIALDVVRNDRPAKAITPDAGDLERAMREKRLNDRPAQRQPVNKSPKQKGDIEIVDLHITQLMDNTAGMSNSDILNYQLDKFREVIDANIKFAGKKIVFIHGKGEGVLRRALLDEMKRRYPRCKAQDASFREYGFGATQITVFP